MRRTLLRLSAGALLILVAGCASAKDIGRQLVQPFVEIIVAPLTWAASIPGSVLAGIGASMPVYGNWCGANHPKRGTTPPAVDNLDTACMRHDLCYEARGKGACECDQRLVEEILGGRNIRTDSFTTNEIKVLTWATHSPCTGCKYISFGGSNYVNVCGNSITIHK